MLQFFKSLYLKPRFFYVVFGLSVILLFSFWWNGIYPLAWLLVFGFGVLVLFDLIALYKTNGLKAERRLADKMSNGDPNKIDLYFENRYGFKIQLEVIDEIPEQFQKRDFLKRFFIEGQKEYKTEYYLRPVERGEYFFGKLNCYASTQLGLVRRRYSFQANQKVKVYPSFIQMKKYDFLAIDRKLGHVGLKKIRRIGHTMEFEQIKEYVRGDDMRTINWKATAKRGNLMANQYQDEKSQPIYTVINTGRIMKMPFAGLKLLDYAINSCLAFSNIALKKNDKVGLITYGKTVNRFIPAQRRKTHLNRISEILYNIDTDFLESDVSHLYARIRKNVNQRSLILWYTNFEHFNSLQRQLPYFKSIARQHVLVVVFFENTELKSVIENESESLSEIYDQTIAEEFENDRIRMLKELQKNSIQAILTSPEDLTVNTINKYLELKARGML